MEFKQHNTNTKKKEDFNELIFFLLKQQYIILVSF